MNKLIKNLKILKREEGIIFVEAAITIPIILFTLLSIVLVCIFFVELLFMQVDIHKFLRKQEGQLSNTRYIEYVNHEYDYITQNNLGYKKLNVNKIHKINSIIPILEPLDKNISANVYVINEKKLIRYKDFFSEILP